MYNGLFQKKINVNEINTRENYFRYNKCPKKHHIFEQVVE